MRTFTVKEIYEIPEVKDCNRLPYPLSVSNNLSKDLLSYSPIKLMYNKNYYAPWQLDSSIGTFNDFTLKDLITQWNNHITYCLIDRYENRFISIYIAIIAIIDLFFIYTASYDVGSFIFCTFITVFVSTIPAMLGLLIMWVVLAEPIVHWLMNKITYSYLEKLNNVTVVKENVSVINLKTIFTSITKLINNLSTTTENVAMIKNCYDNSKQLYDMIINNQQQMKQLIDYYKTFEKILTILIKYKDNQEIIEESIQTINSLSIIFKYYLKNNDNVIDDLITVKVSNQLTKNVADYIKLKD